MAGGIIESCDPDGQCKNRTMLPKASDIYTIRMLTQPMAGGKIESCDPGGRCKSILEARMAKATGERCTDVIKLVLAKLVKQRRHR